MHSGVQSHRVIFIDLGRAIAVTFMLYGHTTSALLAPEYQAGRWFQVWQFQRGLTSSLFLLLGGFAFSIATSRHWAAHVQWSPAILRRMRRFGLFILLGYALHFPAARFVDFAAVTDAKWRSFVAVDVLQLIGVSFIGVQLLVLAARSRRAVTITVFVVAALVIAATPVVWEVDWASRMPLAAAAYLGPAVGSLFPLFPWLAFVLLGVGFGQVYSRWGAAHLGQYANRVLLLPGAALVAAALGLYLWPPAMFGSGAGHLVPVEVLVRAGSCLVLLSAVAHLSRWIDRLPHIFGAVAQESLLIYFVHLCIVYGSVWNRGLAQAYGASLPPGRVLLFVLLVIGSMVALAWYWNRWKHVRPRTARWMSFAVGALLVYALL